jgi:transcription initiation factor TFIIB
LGKTYRGIKKRRTERLQTKLSGPVTKKSQTPKTPEPTAKMSVVGTENQPPDAPAWRENLNTHLICPECRQVPPDLVEENADTICANCGLVLAERLISYESEWRTFNSDEGKGDDPNRVGEAENELYTGSNVGTQIGGGGANVSRETRKLKKAQALQQDNKADKHLQSCYAQIEAWGEQAKLTPGIKNCAKGYYKRIYDNNAMRGKPTEVVLAGCLFIACRQAKAPRSFSEWFSLTKVPKKEIGRVYKALTKFLSEWSNESIAAIEESGGIANRDLVGFRDSGATSADEMCARYNNMLGGPFRVGHVAALLAKKVLEIDDLAGKSPTSNAAACLYFASHLIGFPKSIKQISDIAQVSDATIKGAYKNLLAKKDLLIQPEWLGPQETNKGTGFGRVQNLPGA